MALIDKEVLKAQLNNSICGYCDDCGDNCERCKISVVFETLEALPECNAVDCHLLPKGHGRLIDANALAKRMTEYGWHHSDSTVHEFVDDLPTIIEADKEVDE